MRAGPPRTNRTEDADVDSLGRIVLLLWRAPPADAAGLLPVSSPRMT